jgi:L-malate glycosyltransferase
MKVLFYESRPEWGGAQKCELALLEGLPQLGFDTRFVTSTDGPMLERVRQTKIEVHMIPVSKKVDQIRKDANTGGLFSKFKLSLLIIPHFLEMIKLIRQLQPAVLYTSQFRSQLLIGWLGKLLGKKVIWHIHGEERLDNFMGKVALRTADEIIVVSQTLTEKYQSSFPSHRQKFTYVGNGMDILEKKQIDSTNPTMQLIMVGAIIEGKRQDLAIEATKELVSTGHSIHLHIVGEKPHWHSDEYKGKLHSLVETLELQSYVTFHGWVENPRQLLTQSDVFLLPSDTEGLPLSIIEAMGVGLPVIATNVGGIPELIVNEKTGKLISKNAVNELVEAIAEFIENPDLCSEMGRAALKRYERHYTKQAFLEGVAGVLRTIST